MSDEIKIIKRERMANITKFTDNILSYVTNEMTTKGNIILIIHLLIVIIYLVLMIFLPINRLNIVILVCVIIIHNSVNLYYAKWDTCILLKLERYFYNDISWYGQNTPIFKKLGINDQDSHKYRQLFNFTGWILLYIYYIYRIFKKFFNKKNKKDSKVDKKK
jgi:hypothetical protein